MQLCKSRSNGAQEIEAEAEKEENRSSDKLLLMGISIHMMLQQHLGLLGRIWLSQEGILVIPLMRQHHRLVMPISITQRVGEKPSPTY